MYLYKENGYEVDTKYEQEYYCDTLTPSGDVTTVAKIGTVEYTNLQAAINTCTDGKEIIINLVNSINTNSSFIIEEGQNVVIDLNGKTITADIEGSTIENSGNLTIIDSSSNQVGKIANTKGIAITNTGTLTIGQNDETVSTTCPEISGSEKGVKNTKTLNFYDGIITGSVALEGNVTNRANGYIINKSNANGVEKLTLGK